MSQPPISKATGMQWCRQETALWQRLLFSFYRQYKSYRHSDIQLNTEEIQQLAHNLKNCALPCGAVMLHQQASALSSRGLLPTEAQTSALLKALHDTLAYLETMYPDIIEGKQSEPDLQALLQQIEQHNIKALTLFDQWVTGYALDWPQKTVDDIRLALHSFNFQQAKSLLQTAVTRYRGST